MKHLNNNLYFHMVSIFLSIAVGLSCSTYAGELDFPDEQNAKVSRFKAKGRVLKNELMGQTIPDDEDVEDNIFSGLDEQCGVIDIGNVSNNKPFGQPQKVDVIITGDVINAGNNCK